MSNHSSALLNQMLAHLSPWERAGFLSYMKRFRMIVNGDENDPANENETETQEIKLVTILLEQPDISRDDLMSRFYTKPNRNGLDAIRKRVIKKLKAYVVTLMQDPEKSPLGAILTDIVVAEFYRPRQAEIPARHFIDSAEDRAEQHRHHDLLDGLYSYRTRHESILKTSRDLLAKKRKANAPLFEKKRQLELACADIQIDLNNAIRDGSILDPDRIIDDVLNKLKLTKEETNIPEFQLSMMTIFRSGMISTKQYFRLEPIILARYEALKKSGAFNKGTVEAELGFLYMLAHAHMRNRKFDLMDLRLKQMEPLLQKGFWAHTIYYPKYISLKARRESAQGENKSGIVTLDQGIERMAGTGFAKERLNMELNRVVFWFHEEDFRKSKNLLFQINHNNAGLNDTMGEEWCFKMNLISLIVLHELKDIEAALSQLNRLRKNFRSFLIKPGYSHAKLFLNLIAKVIYNPDVVLEKSFRKKVAKAMENFELKEYDLQSVTFFCWLKCKIQKRNYYEVLLEELNTEGKRFDIGENNLPKNKVNIVKGKKKFTQPNIKL